MEGASQATPRKLSWRIHARRPKPIPFTQAHISLTADQPPSLWMRSYPPPLPLELRKKDHVSLSLKPWQHAHPALSYEKRRKIKTNNRRLPNADFLYLLQSSMNLPKLMTVDELPQRFLQEAASTFLQSKAICCALGGEEGEGLEK